MSIAKRLFLLIGFLVSSLIGVGGVAVWQIDNISDDIEYESNELLPAVEFSGTIAHHYLLLRISVLSMLNSTEPQRAVQLTQQIVLQQKEINGLLLEYQSKHTLDKTNNALLSKIGALLNQYDILVSTLTDLAIQGRREEAVSESASAWAISDQILDAVFPIFPHCLLPAVKNFLPACGYIRSVHLSQLIICRSSDEI